MCGINAEVPVTGVQVENNPTTIVQGHSAEPPCKKQKGTKWARGVLAKAVSADSSRRADRVTSSAAVMGAIDMQIAVHFPELPRAPTQEFHNLVRSVVNSGWTLAAALQVADECRQRGEIWQWEPEALSTT